MGAAGYRRDAEQVPGDPAGSGNPLPRHLAAAKLTGYIDGATEIQNVVIARRLWDQISTSPDRGRSENQ